jgi:uncharacterized membrane protein
MMRWTDEQLRALPRHDGFRMRGLAMTRLEAFTDAAFAFATTMLIISQRGIPHNVGELVGALKDIPAFLASFAAIASFWYAHRQWSRRYGLEDRTAILISLGLIFVMLIFVFPLKMVFSALFAWITAGWLPTSFVLEAAADLPRLFVIYGLGFCALTGLIGLLYVRAIRAADYLALNSLERLKTREDMVSFGVLATTGLVSSIWAALLPAQWGIWAGFCYCTLPISMPLIAIAYDRKARRLESAS